MDSYNLADAKARLSELVERAERGEEIGIKRRGAPAAKIVPAEKPKKRVDIEELRRIRAGQKMWVPDREGECYVAYLRRTDQL